MLSNELNDTIIISFKQNYIIILQLITQPIKIMVGYYLLSLFNYLNKQAI